MGVEKENFLIYGVKAERFGIFFPSQEREEWGEEKDPAFVDVDDYRDLRENYDFRKTPRFVCINDGYNGKYSIYGILIFAGGQDRWGEDKDLNHFITIKDMKKLDKMFTKEVNNQTINYDFAGQVGLIAITHYT